jgi:hypothetical protein
VVKNRSFPINKLSIEIVQNGRETGRGGDRSEAKIPRSGTGRDGDHLQQLLSFYFLLSAGIYFIYLVMDT